MSGLFHSQDHPTWEPRPVDLSQLKKNRCSESSPVNCHSLLEQRVPFAILNHPTWNERSADMSQTKTVAQESSPGIEMKQLGHRENHRVGLRRELWILIMLADASKYPSLIAWLRLLQHKFWAGPFVCLGSKHCWSLCSGNHIPGFGVLLQTKLKPVGL
nr:hypothetical protein Iba_chr14bCG17520 [Ipomoea batatas]